MTIDTKFSTNETVYFLRDGRIRHGTIVVIKATATPMSSLADAGESHTCCEYQIKIDLGTIFLAETLLFASAQECADALAKEAE